MEAHVKAYATPIVARRGDRGRIVRRTDEDAPEWVWVQHGETGRGGWTPWSSLDLRDGTDEVVFRNGYDAIELDVEPGQVLDAGERIGDWLRCRAASGEIGWMPARKLEALDDA